MSKLKETLLSERSILKGKYDTDEIGEEIDGKFEDMAFTMETVMIEKYVSSKTKKRLHRMIMDLEDIRASIIDDLKKISDRGAV